jgi:hypothetical protein
MSSHVTQGSNEYHIVSARETKSTPSTGYSTNGGTEAPPQELYDNGGPTFFVNKLFYLSIDQGEQELSQKANLNWLKIKHTVDIEY